MNNDVVISVEHVSKKYCKSLKRSMLYGMMDIGRNMLGRSSRPDVLRKDEFWALDDVSFEVKKGETLGIIGPNGSGKTTLLKLLNGIFWPDKGKITIKGKVGALIELGAGFHPLLTGRENIYINAAIFGMTKKEVDEKFVEIIEFADIGDFIDTPVKNYSSGMFVRLGFAVAVHCKPDILLIDEVLSVGDMNFQRKCVETIKDMKDNGTTIIFISHNLDSVIGICQKTLYLKSGKLKAMGTSSKVAMEYRNDISTEFPIKRSKPVKTFGFGKVTNKLVEITNVTLLDSKGEKREVFITGEALIVRIYFTSYKTIENSVFGVAIYSSDGTYVYACNTKYDNISVPELKGDGFVEYKIPHLNLLSGSYLLTAGILQDNLSVFYDIWEKAICFEVSTNLHDHGMFYLEHIWNLKTVNIKGNQV